MSPVQQLKKYLEFMTSDRAISLMPQPSADLVMYPEMAYTLGCQEGYKRALMYLEETIESIKYANGTVK